MKVQFGYLGLSLVSISLAACGASVPATLNSAPGSTSISIISADGSTSQVSQATGTLSSVDLDDAIVLDYVALIPTTGIAGIPTKSADMPASGSFSYAGQSQVTLVENAGLLRLDGDATVTFDAGAGTVDILLDGMSGDTIQAGSGTVSNGAVDVTIALDGANICSGNKICGGAFTLSGSDTSATAPAAAAVSVSGGFFGPGAENVGGLITVLDSGNLDLSAGFVAALS